MHLLQVHLNVFLGSCANGHFSFGFRQQMGSQLTFNFTPKPPALPDKTKQKNSSVPVLVPAPTMLKQQHWVGRVPSTISVHCSHGPMRRFCLVKVGTLSCGDCSTGQRVLRGWGNFLPFCWFLRLARDSWLLLQTHWEETHLVLYTCMQTFVPWPGLSSITVMQANKTGTIIAIGRTEQSILIIPWQCSWKLERTEQTLAWLAFYGLGCITDKVILKVALLRSVFQ